MKDVFKRILCFIVGVIGGAVVVWWFGVVPIKTRPLDLTQLDSQLTLVKEKTDSLIRMFETAFEVKYWNRDLSMGERGNE